MTTFLRIEVGKRARRQVNDLNIWWRKNRSGARTAVHDELKRAFRLILNQPHIGPPALDVELPDVRRIHLSRIRHYLYYRLIDSEGAIEVLADLVRQSRPGPTDMNA